MNVLVGKFFGKVGLDFTKELQDLCWPEDLKKIYEKVVGLAKI